MERGVVAAVAGGEAIATEAAAKPGMPVAPTSRMQSSSTGWPRTPTAAQTASAWDLAAVAIERGLTSRDGILRFVNVAVLSPGRYANSDSACATRQLFPNWRYSLIWNAESERLSAVPSRPVNRSALPVPAKRPVNVVFAFGAVVMA